MTVKEDTTFSFILIPLCNVAFNIALAILLSLRRSHDEDNIKTLLNLGDKLIGLVANTSITIVALTFSLTVLSIQIAAQTYSPRLLDDFIKDPISKFAVGINLGAFSYAYTVQYLLELADVETHGVPHVAIHFLTVQMVAVIAMFVFFIHYFINGFRLETILTRALESSWAAAQDLERKNQYYRSRKKGDYRFPAVPPNAYKVAADESGYLSRFSLDRGGLLMKARKLDIYILYHPHIGEFVAEGTLLAYVWDASQHAKNRDASSDDRKEDLPKRIFRHSYNHSQTKKNEEIVEEELGRLVASGVEFSTFRSGELDVSLGIQQLCDIAIRALSAAINDPHTAVQALDCLSTLFGRLARLDMNHASLCDSTGQLRLSAPRRNFNYLLSIADPIRSYGGGDLLICYRLIRFYGDLGAILKRLERFDRIPGVLAQLEQCMIVCRKNFDESGTEFKSIQQLYDHALDLIAWSDRLVLTGDESVEDDLNELETTFEKPTSDYMKNLPDTIKPMLDGASQDFEVEEAA